MSYYRSSNDSQARNSKPPQNVYQTNYNYSKKQSQYSKGTMRSRPEDAYKNYQQKMKALARIDYLNPIARLQYEQKLTELHTKQTAKSQQVINKKLASKNPMAEFIEEESNEDEIFDELMEYKYGNQGSKNKYFYDGGSTKKQFVFCPLCDQIHTEPPSKHTTVCDYKELCRSPVYYFESLDRIKESLSRLMSQEAEQLKILVQRIRVSQYVNKQLTQLWQICSDDPVLSKICEKLQQIIHETQE